MPSEKSLLILNSLQVEPIQKDLKPLNPPLLVDEKGTPLVLKKRIIGISPESTPLLENNKVRRQTDLILGDSDLDMGDIRQPEDFQDRLYKTFDDFLSSFQEEGEIEDKRSRKYWHQQQARKFLENFSDFSHESYDWSNDRGLIYQDKNNKNKKSKHLQRFEVQNEVSFEKFYKNILDLIKIENLKGKRLYSLLKITFHAHAYFSGVDFKKFIPDFINLLENKNSMTYLFTIEILKLHHNDISIEQADYIIEILNDKGEMSGHLSQLLLNKYPYLRKKFKKEVDLSSISVEEIISDAKGEQKYIKKALSETETGRSVVSNLGSELEMKLTRIKQMRGCKSSLWNDVLKPYFESGLFEGIVEQDQDVAEIKTCPRGFDLNSENRAQLFKITADIERHWDFISWGSTHLHTDTLKSIKEERDSIFSFNDLDEDGKGFETKEIPLCIVMDNEKEIRIPYFFDMALHIDQMQVLGGMYHLRKQSLNILPFENSEEIINFLKDYRDNPQEKSFEVLVHLAKSNNCEYLLQSILRCYNSKCLPKIQIENFMSSLLFSKLKEEHGSVLDIKHIKHYLNLNFLSVEIKEEIIKGIDPMNISEIDNFISQLNIKDEYSLYREFSKKYERYVYLKKPENHHETYTVEEIEDDIKNENLHPGVRKKIIAHLSWKTDFHQIIHLIEDENINNIVRCDILEIFKASLSLTPQIKLMLMNPEIDSHVRHYLAETLKFNIELSHDIVDILMISEGDNDPHEYGYTKMVIIENLKKDSLNFNQEYFGYSIMDILEELSPDRYGNEKTFLKCIKNPIEINETTIKIITDDNFGWLVAKELLENTDQKFSLEDMVTEEISFRELLKVEKKYIGSSLVKELLNTMEINENLFKEIINQSFSEEVSIELAKKIKGDINPFEKIIYGETFLESLINLDISKKNKSSEIALELAKKLSSKFVLDNDFIKNILHNKKLSLGFRRVLAEKINTEFDFNDSVLDGEKKFWDLILEQKDVNIAAGLVKNLKGSYESNDIIPNRGTYAQIICDAFLSGKDAGGYYGIFYELHQKLNTQTEITPEYIEILRKLSGSVDYMVSEHLVKKFRSYKPHEIVCNGKTLLELLESENNLLAVFLVTKIQSSYPMDEDIQKFIMNKKNSCSKIIEGLENSFTPESIMPMGEIFLDFIKNNTDIAYLILKKLEYNLDLTAEFMNYITNHKLHGACGEEAAKHLRDITEEEFLDIMDQYPRLNPEIIFILKNKIK